MEFFVDEFFQSMRSGSVSGIFGVIWNDGMVFASEEFGYSVNEVAQIIEKFSVVLCNEFAPEKLGV